MSQHRFCTDLCRERGEPLEGLGDAPQRVLMLAWPRGKWRVPRWESVGMSPALSAALHAAAHAGLHIALVDKVEAPDSLPTLHALPENVSAAFSSESDLIAAIEGCVAGRPFPGRQDPRLTILCCTDSRRDPCCARYGFATYKALVGAADPERFHIVQSTHIGGCRFAASLLVMPQRHRYGRMTPEQVPHFLAALERGQLFLPHYKGRDGLSEPGQVAELAALRWAAQRGRTLPAVEVLGHIPETAIDGQRLTLGADLDGTRLSIRLTARSFPVQSTCSQGGEGHDETMLRWCLDGIAPQPGA